MAHASACAIFLYAKNLHMSKKSSTFARLFVGLII